MKVKNLKINIALFIIFFLLNGCGTLWTGGYAGFNVPVPIYCGVQSDVGGIITYNTEGSPKSNILCFLDLPFSFLADTILLPYTIPYTIFRSPSEETQICPYCKSIFRPTMMDPEPEKIGYYCIHCQKKFWIYKNFKTDK